MSDDEVSQYVLDEDDFDALEELLISDVVPEDCMNLEALDGYLAAVVCSPVVIPMATWMPHVWTAHADSVSFAAGSRMQKVIRLVIGYHNELATTAGLAEGWQPFCYAGQETDDIPLASEWIEGFELGVEQWPLDWAAQVGDATAGRVRAELERLLAPWREDGGLADGDDLRRREWLDGVVEVIETIMSIWAECGRTRPEPIVLEPAPAVGGPGVGRNDPCPCGSGRKFKKCCGASVA
ncbi:MAG TPA: UPF0149 family protein [Rhodocyclaceae bacterium]|nr:UPF0149 family protein [Rhodocyclaceae bacterium]